MKQQVSKIHSNGYVALATVLVIAVVVTTVGLSVATQSIDTVQSTLFDERGHQVRNVVESCVEDALLSLNKNNAIASSITLPDGSCSVTINSQTGLTWNFTVTSTVEQQTASAVVEAERDSAVSVTSWLIE